MLVLSRKKDGKIIIQTKHGEIIEITVCDIDPYKTKLGFKAPDDCKITRFELIERSGLSVPEFFEKF
jgi:carbon storage regulator CsrA